MFFQDMVICSNDYASHARIEIMCKKPVPMPRDVFCFELISFVIPGIIKPWLECQPEEFTPREGQPGDVSIRYEIIYIYIYIM